MSEKIRFDYFYGQEAEMLIFYKIPKLLFTNNFFKILSTDAKVLYGLMLDRMSISIKNKWFDERNRAYIYFSVEDTMEMLNCKKNKAIDTIKELDTETGLGLIEKKRQGQGKPTVIYVKTFMTEEAWYVQKLEKQTSEIGKKPTDNNSEVGNSTFLKLEKQTSRIPKNQRLEVGKKDTNNIKKNNIEINKTNLIISADEDTETDEYTAYSEIIKQNLEWKILYERYPCSPKGAHMIDLKKCNNNENTFTVEPTNNIFRELGNNTYNYLDLLSELIDDSIAARIPNEKLLIEVELVMSEDNKKEQVLIVRDNAKGIAFDEIASAISPAWNSGGKTLNEHGMGMKQAIAGLGELSYLATKTEATNPATVITEFKFGNVTPLNCDVAWEHGTEICIKNLKDIVEKGQQYYTKYLIPYLGARYRRYLSGEQPEVRINFRMLSADKKDQNGYPETIREWMVQPVAPIYFHPNLRNNKPVIEKKILTGNDWKAEITFGYAPNDSEYETIGMEKVKSYHPYYVSISRQGFDILKNDRVINFHQLSEIKLINTRHNCYNLIRGEINLLSGFTTAITKNAIVSDRAYRELMEKIKEILEEKRYLEKKTYPDELPENLLRDRLVNIFKTSVVYSKKNVVSEYTVGKLNGKVDILADGEAWEIKTQQINGLDVYQLFAYMDMGDIENGYILGKDISTGGEEAINFINEKHRKNIKFVSLDEFNIVGPPDMEELDKYY